MKQKYIGEDKLENAPIGEPVEKPSRPITRQASRERLGSISLRIFSSSQELHDRKRGGLALSLMKIEFLNTLHCSSVALTRREPKRKELLRCPKLRFFLEILISINSAKSKLKLLLPRRRLPLGIRLVLKVIIVSKIEKSSRLRFPNQVQQNLVDPELRLNLLYLYAK